MKLEEFDDLSRDKWFEGIKAVCRSRAIKELCIEAAVLLLFIYLTYVYLYGLAPGIGNNILICVSSLFFIAFGWLIVTNLRFVLRVDRLDTPRQLLHIFKKWSIVSRKLRYLVLFLALVVLAVNPYAINLHDWFVVGMDLTWSVVFIGLVIYSYLNEDILDDYLNNLSYQNEEIIERLQDLIDNK